MTVENSAVIPPYTQSQVSLKEISKSESMITTTSGYLAFFILGGEWRPFNKPRHTLYVGEQFIYGTDSMLCDVQI